MLTYWSALVLEMLNKPFPPSKNRYMMIGLFGLFKMYNAKMNLLDPFATSVLLCAVCLFL